MRPWDKQKIKKESGEPVTSTEDILSIAEETNNKTIQALFIILYLTGARVCEIVRKAGYDLQRVEINQPSKKYRYNKIRNPEKDKPSIKKKQVTFETKKGRPVMLLFLRNQKNQLKKTKEIPIPLDRDESKRMADILMNYIQDMEPEQELFPFGYQYAYKLLKPFSNPHWIRHIRATHLTVKYDLSTPLLKNYMGWTDERPASVYQEMKWGDILDKL